MKLFNIISFWSCSTISLLLPTTVLVEQVVAQAPAYIEAAPAGDLCAATWEESFAIMTALGQKGDIPCTGPTIYSQPPAEFVKMGVVGVGTATNGQTSYLTNPAHGGHLPPVSHANAGMKTADCPVGEDYCFQAAGSLVGTADAAGPYGFIGYAGYVATGSLSYHTNNIRFGMHDIISTPSNIRSVETCVLDYDVDPTCDPSGARTADAGTYKFAVFAISGGTDFASEKTSQGWTHWGLRQYYDFRLMDGSFGENKELVKVYATTGAGEVQLTFGQTGTFSELGSDHILSLRAVGKNTEFNLGFEQRYNRGTIFTSGANFATATVTATENVKIHLIPTDCLDNTGLGVDYGCLYVDYVFVIPDDENEFMLYDPTISMRSLSSGSGGVEDDNLLLIIIVASVVLGLLLAVVYLKVWRRTAQPKIVMVQVVPV